MVGREGKRRLGVMVIEVGNGNKDFATENLVGNRNDDSEIERKGFGFRKEEFVRLEWEWGWTSPRQCHPLCRTKL
ncbi:hypothetical protein L484_010032 [Morus notabilis]|uniref:Uncharacterized protein n=1 Tax=Morus notabilis TaxID=981085 RepID=W9RWI6_9ROSA|nr:hypothetical protein L484_010032 [Morus notabilis]